MKLTAIILLSACIAASAKGHSQNVTLTLKDAPLEKVFSEIKKQTGYTFVYKTEVLANAKTVSLTVNNASLQQVLDLCFKEQPLTYKIFENTIAIKSKETELAQVSGPVTTDVSSPPVDISGKVTDKDGNPLAGAYITVKGKNKLGATTNNDGVFVLKGVEADDVIVISYAELQTQSLKVGTTASFLVKLEPGETTLNEVIINKGYYTEKQRNTVGNVTTIKAADIEKQPVQNPLLALQGRVPGLEVTQLTGLPGGALTVRIQGRNSIQSGLDPLYVIDGIPFGTQYSNSANRSFNTFQEGIVLGGSPLSFINPNDIESIDILKDADATAIFGSRAANGAILITTKKGKIGKIKLTLNLQQGWGKVPQNVEVLNKDQYFEMREEAIRNDGLIPSANPTATAPFVYAPDLMFWDKNHSTDLRKELIGGTAKYTNVNASISGGSAAVQYLIGATYKRLTTVFPSDFDDKTGNLLFNINSSSVNQRLKLQLSGIYSYDQNQLPGLDLTAQAFLMPPNAPAIWNTDGTLNWAQNSVGNSTWINPLALIRYNEYNNSTKNLVTNISLSYRIVAGLEFRSNFGYTSTQNNIYNPTRLESERPESRPTSFRNAEIGNRIQNTWIVEPQMQYSGKIGQGKIDGLIGATVQKSTIDVLSVRGSGYSTDLLMKTLSAATSISVLVSNSITTRFSGLFGRLNYNLDNKYLFNLTMRRDGSNKFGDENKFHNFGSIGFGWIFSQEKPVQQQFPFLSFGKLRVSYGSTGNDQITDFSYLSTYSINNPTVLYQNSIGLNVTRIPNPYLQWEVTRKWQTGLDLGFLQDRIMVSAVYVRNRSSNQLISYNLPSLTGFTSITKNIPALIQNSSLEFTLNTANVKGRNITWNSNINITIPRNKLLRFPGIETTVYSSGTNGVIVGQPLGVQRVVPFGGVNPSNGGYILIDKNGNPILGTSIAVTDKTILVSPRTIFYGGIGNSLSYKGFQLDFLFQFVRKIGTNNFFYDNGISYPGKFGAYSNGGENQPISVIKRWQKPGDNMPIGRFTTNGSSFILGSNVWYSDESSFIRLKNVSMSWQLPQSWLGKTKFQNARIYAHAQNLLTFTKYTGLDPETESISTLPPLSMITTGVQIDF